ncbi:hypothetical protein TNCV_1674201 [Trichonephila clavipes]|nr:hypothetical protein TNCV_1674201 [Trichonephila clavipes]
MSAAIAEPPNRDTKDGGEFNADIYRRIATVYGKQCLGRTSWNSWSKSFQKGQQRISDVLDNIHPSPPLKPK